METQATDIDKQARETIIDMLDKGHTVSSIARDLGVNKGLIPYILGGGHSPTLLEAMGLPVLELRPVPVCMECGEVHTMHKTCSEIRQVKPRYRKCVELNRPVDRQLLESVARENGFENWTELCRYIIDTRYAGGAVSIVTETVL